MSDAAQAALAAYHVRRGRELIAEQRALIDRLWLIGLSTETEESLLRTFETTLAIFEEDLRRLTE